jgi:hypothetical protein
MYIKLFLKSTCLACRQNLVRLVVRSLLWAQLVRLTQVCHQIHWVQVIQILLWCLVFPQVQILHVVQMHHWVLIRHGVLEILKVQLAQKALTHHGRLEDLVILVHHGCHFVLQVQLDQVLLLIPKVQLAQIHLEYQLNLVAPFLHVVHPVHPVHLARILHGDLLDQLIQILLWILLVLDFQIHHEIQQVRTVPFHLSILVGQTAQLLLSMQLYNNQLLSHN